MERIKFREQEASQELIAASDELAHARCVAQVLIEMSFAHGDERSEALAYVAGHLCDHLRNIDRHLSAAVGESAPSLETTAAP